MMGSQSPFSPRSRALRDPLPATVRSTPPAEASSLPRRPRLIVAGALGLLGALAASYTVGRVEAAAKTEAVRAAAREVSEKQDEAVATLRARLRAQSTRVTLLEARRRLHLSLIALGQRNFGIARDELRKAARLLAGTKGAASESLKALSQDLESYETVVTENLGDQRADLIAFAARLDEAIDSRAH